MTPGPYETASKLSGPQYIPELYFVRARDIENRGRFCRFGSFLSHSRPASSVSTGSRQDALTFPCFVRIFLFLVAWGLKSLTHTQAYGTVPWKESRCRIAA